MASKDLACMRRFRDLARCSEPVASFAQRLGRISAAKRNSQLAFLLGPMNGMAVKTQAFGSETKSLGPIAYVGIVHGADDTLLVHVTFRTKADGRIAKLGHRAWITVRIVARNTSYFTLGAALCRRVLKQ